MVLAVVTVFAIFDFIAFVSIALALGGDAINGKVEGGRFFLGSHGHFTEVSQRVFTYSKWHAYTVFAAYAVMFLGGAVVGAQQLSGRDAT